MLDGDRLIRFSDEDLTLFSIASGDKNPLHLSMEYASHSAFGERVVFGALGAIACLSHWRPPDHERISDITVDFLRPMFVGVNYNIKSAAREGMQTFSLNDGTVPLVSVAVHLAQCEVGAELSAETPFFAVSEAVVRPEASIVASLTVSGKYACDPVGLEKLLRKMHFEADPFLAGVLSWASYSVGMELPGQSALFRRLMLTFEAPPQGSPLMQYEVSVLNKRQKLGHVTCVLTLQSGGRILARGKCEALIRPEIACLGPAVVDRRSKGEEMVGRIVLVVGGSRGLGAALDLALKARGATVIQFSRSNGDNPFGHGDAGDPTRLIDLRERIIREYGRLDLLICNAFPSIHPLRFEPNALDRIQGYLSRATMMVAAPLCVFLEPLHDAGGRLAVISSSAVENPVREWPQYIAAKCAIEGYARVAPLQYPRIESLIVRPPKLLTNMTNTPLGRAGAMRPEEFALGLAKRLQESVRAGTCDVYPSSRGLYSDD
jgi:NAD(P)-dependent dehydrogenase (short-subunit alcohol dehydrogenase family)